QAGRLPALIMDLLSLARIESGTEAFVFQAVPLAEVVRECVERHLARAEGKGQRLEAVPPAADGVTSWADEEAVSQILENLVDNALKYTPAGGRVCVHWWGEEGQACVEVRDTRIGTAEHHPPTNLEPLPPR